MIKEIGLFYEDIWPEKKNGPAKVAKNLIAGLSSLGVTVHRNALLKYTGILQPYPLPDLKQNALIGPNSFNLPIEYGPSSWEIKRNIVAPSEWIANRWKEDLDSKHNVHVWPVGIDTDYFTPSTEPPKIDCLFYYKLSSLSGNLQKVLKKMIDDGISYEGIIYGNYEEEELISIARSSKYCIMVASSETQGIAYQEILSMNIPMYVLDCNVTHHFKPNNPEGVTSAPYFDDRCGIKHPDLSRFDEFLDRLDEFSPREYILENLTLKKCASEYLSLLEKCYE
mgnify:CR=1 FL=1|tara:strand:+ start:1082 stop:1924 length:843 start_codon:yes stop_codon:yes gene_type:complete